MKRTLPNTSDNFTSIKNTKTTVQLLFFIVLTCLFLQTTQAQCTSPYSRFESIDGNVSGVTAYNNMISRDWKFEGTGGTATTSIFYPNATNFRTGKMGLIHGFSNTDAALITPMMMNIAEFSFFIKYSTGGPVAAQVLPTAFEVQISDNNGVTWTTLTNGLNSLTLTHNPTFDCNVILPAAMNTTSFQQIKLSVISPALGLPSSPEGYRFRILDKRVSPNTVGVMILDDFTWKSSIPSENNIIVMETGATTCTPAVDVSVGDVYYFYDNGGQYDSYSGSQNQTIIFTPTDSQTKIKITFELANPDAASGPGNIYSTETTNDYLQVYDSNNFTSLVATYSGTTTTAPGPRTSTATDGSLSFRFVSNAGVPTQVQSGFKIKVEAVACGVPSSLTASGTFSGANLSWTGTAAATDYEIYRATAATPVPNSSTTPTYTVGSSATTYSSTGLTVGTTYYFWVRSVCGSTEKSDWVGFVSATPICSPTTVPYLENFNGVPLGQIPTCTTKDTGSAWAANNINGNLNCNSVNTAFYSKGVSLTAGVTYRLSYDYSTNLNGTADLSVLLNNSSTILAPNSPSVTYSVLQTNLGFSTLQSNMINFTVPTDGTYYAKFLLTGLSVPGTGAINIDNVRIEVENCFAPTSVTASGVTASMATIGWTPPASAPSNGYQYYVSTSSTTPGYSVTVTGNTGFGQNSVVLTGLTASTTFYVWVRSNCSGSYSAWSLVRDFTTSAGALPVLISATGPITQCDYSFFDSGGATGNYGNGEVHNLTLYPAVAGYKLRVVFSSFATEDNYDSLSIYNGNSTGAPLISSGLPVGTDFSGPIASCPAGSFRGTGSPGTVISTAADGSLTFRFMSDGSVLRAGWSAFVSCVQTPNIVSFTPLNNNCGSATTVTVTGTNLSGIVSATIGGIPAAIVSNTATQVVLTIPAGAKSGLIRLTNANSYGESATPFIIQSPPPVTADATICIGGTGALSSSTVCGGYTNSVTSINLNTINLAIANGTTGNANRPDASTNSAVCNFLAGNGRNYVAIPFQVSVTGNYIFRFAKDVAADDPMGYITRSPFLAGTCSPNFVVGDDDSQGTLNPRMNATLTVGVEYILYTTTYGSANTTLNPLGTWSVTAPAGGSVLLYANAQVQWYTVNSGGTPLPNSATDGTFNPVGVTGSGIANNTTPISRTFYAACPINPDCRTPAVFTIVNTTPGTASSSQSICVGSATDLTLTGNGAPVTTWQYNATDATFATGTIVTIPSSNSTTLTSAQIGSFEGSRYYRAVITVGICTSYSNIVTITFNKTVWNGTAWSNGDPTATKAVEFQGDYTSSGDLSACSVTVISGDVIIDTEHTLTVQNNVNVIGGTLTFEDDASLYQPVDVANATGVYAGGNTGNIRIKREASPMFRYDYTYWSSPVNPQVFINISPNTPSNFSYHFNPTANNWAYFNPNGIMRPGKGYILRAPIDFNLSPGMPLVHTAEFLGVPNNGTITMPVSGGASQMNLLGNPYPSSLSATAFITTNLVVGGTLYFWTHNTQENAPNQYNRDDYALFNLVGGTATASTVGAGNNTTPLGFIASGQSFFVEGVASGNVTYTNTMRRTGNNSQFYRSSEEQSSEDNLEKHRYWLDISDNQQGFKQMLIGYVETATNEIDRLFDAKWMDNNNPIALYAKVEDYKLSILGKPLAFDVNERIPLAYKTTTAGQLTIDLSNYDGLFENQNIYLEDKLLNVIHDLKESNYVFTTAVGTFEDRFELRYTTEALGVNKPIFNENSVIVYKNQQGLLVDTGKVPMKEVTIYDVRGRLLASQNNVNQTSTVFTTLPTTQQVLLVKVISEAGVTVTKKVVY